MIDSYISNDDLEGALILVNRRMVGGGASTGGVVVEEQCGFSWIYTRCRPGELRNALQALSDVQKCSVREMGFGGLLLLDIWDTPTRLGRWLVESFDPRSRTITLSTGERLHIAPEDVAITLGFPMGDVPMVRKSKSVVSETGKLWRALFGEKMLTLHLRLS